MMRNRPAWLAVFPLVMCEGLARGLGGCSNGSNGTTTDDGGATDAFSDVFSAEDSAPSVDSSMSDASDDAAITDAGIDAAVTGMTIVNTNGGPLQGAPGDAVPLAVVFTLSDGTTRALPAGTTVSWIAPQTVIPQNPDDAGPNSVIPDAGNQPLAFYVLNPYRTPLQPGVLFVVAQGTEADASVTVVASLADAGTLSAVVSILPAPVGDPDSGANLYLQWFNCVDCHGFSAAGTPPMLLTDGGLYLVDGAPIYSIDGTDYPYPAPGLNDVADSGNLASDPAWSAPLLGMAAQADMDNRGVALRAPMAQWTGKLDPSKTPINAQDFANIYAWLKTQTSP